MSEPGEKQPVNLNAEVNKSVKKRKKKKRRKQQQQQQHDPEELRVSDAVVAAEVSAPRPDCAHSELVRGIFQIGKKSHDVVLTTARITWTPIQPEDPTGHGAKKSQEDFVDLKDVFAVKVKRRRSAGQQSGGTLLGLTLFVCKRKGAKLKDHTVHLNNLSSDHCEVWFKHLKDILNGFGCRPKCLKVFVNPSSHRREAQQVYEDQVAPLFKLADIQTDVIITERRGHALSILKECSLDEYDGVVCVGGDGYVSEVSHGLLLRAQMDAGRDTDSVFMPVQAALPLGVIPAGSTDVVASSVHGIRHPVTAALHIIMGNRQAVDVCTVNSSGRLVRFCFSVMFGFGGRTLAQQEKLQWIPNVQRREISFLTTLTNLKPEDCELSFIPSSGAVLDQTDAESENELSDTGEDGPWQTRRGLYLNISIMSIPCLCSMAPRGLAPFTRLNNSSMALVAVGNASRAEFIKHLKRYSNMNNQFSFSFVETQSVCAVRLRPRSHSSGWTEETSEENEECDSKSTPIISSEGTYPWNIDGELLELPGEVLIRVHPGVLTLFGADVEEADEKPVKCSCI